MTIYKLLKQIEIEDSLPVWSTFDTSRDSITTEFWKIPPAFLIQHWFIEIVDEEKWEEHPKYKIWDYVVSCYSWPTELNYMKITEIRKHNGRYEYNWLFETFLRDPTEEELKKYFR